MAFIDLSPLYRSSIGFDRVGNLLNDALRSQTNGSGYPHYDIEVVSDDRYSIALAVAGFKQSELEVEVENGVLSIRGRRAPRADSPNFLHQGIASRDFERKFHLADHVEVIGANLQDGILVIDLEKMVPEEMKPRQIAIGTTDVRLESQKAA